MAVNRMKKIAENSQQNMSSIPPQDMITNHGVLDFDDTSAKESDSTARRSSKVRFSMKEN